MDWAKATARQDEKHLGFGIILGVGRYVYYTPQPLYWQSMIRGDIDDVTIITRLTNNYH